MATIGIVTGPINRQVLRTAVSVLEYMLDYNLQNQHLRQSEETTKIAKWTKTKPHEITTKTTLIIHQIQKMKAKRETNYLAQNNQPLMVP